MFLLHINKYKLKKIKYHTVLIEKIKKYTKLLGKTTKAKETKNIENIVKTKHLKFLNYKSNYFIKYVIGIHISGTNIVISLCNIKGEIKYFISANSLKLNKKQNKITTITKLFKILLLKNPFLKQNNYTILHFKNINQRTAILIYSFASNYLKNIVSIKIFNNKPHNGCRPKKIKRKKNKIIFKY